MNKQHILIVILAVFTLIISGGYGYYRYEKKILRQEKYGDLKTIAVLKTNQILEWREERLADAHVVAECPFFRQTLQRWLLSKDSALEKDLLKRFDLLRYNYRYEDVILVSGEGRVLLNLNGNRIQIDSETIDFSRKALQENKTFISDFYFCTTHNTIHFDVLAPVLDDKNVPLGVLVLRVNPYDYLYPLIQSWPTSSRTAETLIVRRDGDSALFENELRHISGTALRLRIALTDTAVPAVQAVLGGVGIFEGTDYRGVRVLSDVRPVPGTPWFMISKVDQSEIFSELKYRTVIVIIITLLLLLFSGICISWIYNNRQKNIYKKLLETGNALQQSQEIYRTILYSIGDAVITTDLKGCINNMNPAAERLTCWKEPDVVGRKIEDVFNIIAEDSRDKVESPVRRVLTEGLLVGLTNHTLLISKDGKEIPISESGAPVRNGENEITGMVLVFHDQTHERMALKVLKESEARFKSAFDNMLEGCQILDFDWRYVYINDTADVHNRCPKEELLGKRYMDMWPGIEKTEIFRKIRQCFQDRISSQMENEFVFPDGARGRFDIRIQPVPEGVFILSIDITEQKKAEESILLLNRELEQRVLERTAELAEANKELEAFSYSVSHDLRAPLRAIDGFSRFIVEDYSDKLDNEGKRMLSLIRGNTQKMDQLINDMLNLSRVSRRDLRYSRIDMTQMARSIYDETAPDVIKDIANLIVDDLPEVYADPVFIKQVWINLLSNAIKFTSKKMKPQIRISGKKEPFEIIYSVSDNGAGFNQQYVDKLFGVFQRLHSSEDFEGTGVGLAIVQRIIHRHGGKVWAEGELGKGATFYFSLPLKK